MRHEFPILYEKVSVWVATPLVYLWAVVYTQHTIISPGTDIYSVGMAAFGVTAALSGVCFAMAVAPGAAVQATTYAGEKFLHSAILLVQTLLVVAVRDAVLRLQFVGDHPTVAAQTKGISAVVLSFVAIAAVWTWHHGFSELNAALWKGWERRIRESNELSKQSRASEQTSEESVKTERSLRSGKRVGEEGDR